MTGALTEIVTMDPVIRVGRAAWDQRLLPRDEFAARLDAAVAVARKAGTEALVVFANAARAECLTYLTNFAPTARWAALLVVPGREPALLAGLGGRREERYQRTVSCVNELVHAPLSGQTIMRALADRGVATGRLAVAGLDFLPARPATDIAASLRDFELVTIDAELAQLWQRTSHRELALLAAAAAILQEAKQQAVRAFSATRSPSVAAAAADRVGRLRGCRDVRILIGGQHGAFRPYEGVTDEKPADLLVAYVAVDWLGYWAELAFTYPQSVLSGDADLRAALSRVAEAAWPGARPAELRGGFTTGELHVRGLGLSITELPDDETRWTELRAGDAISLLAVGRYEGRMTLASSLIAVGESGSCSLQSWRP
jgi:Xaa-Pro aminopeptidase